MRKSLSPAVAMPGMVSPAASNSWKLLPSASVKGRSTATSKKESGVQEKMRCMSTRYGTRLPSFSVSEIEVENLRVPVDEHLTAQRADRCRPRPVQSNPAARVGARLVGDEFEAAGVVVRLRLGRQRGEDSDKKRGGFADLGQASPSVSPLAYSGSARSAKKAFCPTALNR